jgi:hypothetical protein
MLSIKPYQIEEESLAISDLTVENRVDRVSVYGSIELTRDKAGLEQAKTLKEVIDAVVAALEEEKSLPDHISIKATLIWTSPGMQALAI